MFSIGPAYQIRYANLKAHTGDMLFRGENPANGALVDYWVSKTDTVVALSVHDASGQLIQTLAPAGGRGVMRGVNRVVWNLRHADLPIRGGGGGDDDDEAPRGDSAPGPLVAPGTYMVRMVVGGKTLEQKVEVREDPRIDVTPEIRKQWTDATTEVASTIRQFAAVNDKIQKIVGGDGPRVVEMKRQSRELMSRLGGLFGVLNRWTGAPTQDQLSELKFYQEMAAALTKAAGNY